MYAYDKIYLEKARTALGRMLDYAVYDCGFELKKFYKFFLQSSLSKQFESGNPSVIAGKSGVEIAREVLWEQCGQTEYKKPRYTMNRSEEYWTGWVLAYYQWYTARSFSEIEERISVEEVCAMYDLYHEMDIRQFADAVDAMEPK